MNIDQLKTFCKVVESSSFSKASEELFCSQPAISKQIKSLENHLGFSLFDRQGKKIVINYNGKIAYKYSQRILNEASEMQREILEANNSLSTVVSFGATSFIGVHLVTPCIRVFKETFPDVSLSFTIDFIPNILKMLQLNKFSFAFIAESDLLLDYPNIETKFLKEDELVLVVPTTHPWASKNFITAMDLSNELFLISQPDSAIRKFIESELLKSGIVLNNINNLYNIEGIKQSILSGHGVSILPKGSIINELNHKLLVEVPINNLILKRKLLIAYKKNKVFTPMEKAFIETLL